MKHQMKWMIKWTALLLCLVLSLSALFLIACDGDTTDGTSDGTSDGDTPGTDTPGGSNVPDGSGDNPIAPGLMNEGEGVALVNPDGSSRYLRVIRGELAKETEKQAAILLRKTLTYS